MCFIFVAAGSITGTAVVGDRSNRAHRGPGDTARPLRDGRRQTLLGLMALPGTPSPPAS